MVLGLELFDEFVEFLLVLVGVVGAPDALEVVELVVLVLVHVGVDLLVESEEGGGLVVLVVRVDALYLQVGPVALLVQHGQHLLQNEAAVGQLHVDVLDVGRVHLLALLTPTVQLELHSRNGHATTVDQLL